MEIDDNRVLAVRLEEGIRWGTFFDDREKRWLDRGDVVYASEPYPTRREAFDATVALKKTTFDHMKEVGIYNDSILPVLRDSGLGDW